MELKITTCPVCGNRYFQEDYPKCPVCAGIIKKQGETEAMTEREFDMNGSGTLLEDFVIENLLDNICFILYYNHRIPPNGKDAENVCF